MAEDGNVVPVDQTVARPRPVGPAAVQQPVAGPNFSDKMRLWKQLAGEL